MQAGLARLSLCHLRVAGFRFFFLENLETQMSGNSAIVRWNRSGESRVREDRKSSSVGKKLEKSWDVLLGKIVFSPEIILPACNYSS